MRIALVSHYYPPHVGGLEAVVRHQARTLAAAGHEVVVITSAPPAPAGVSVEDGVEVHRLPAANPFERAGIPFPLTNPIAFVRVVRAVGRVDVVHAHDVLYATTWMATLWAWVTRRPLIVHQHVGMIDHPRRVVGWVQRVVYGVAGRLVVAKASRFLHLNSRVEQLLRDLGARPEQLLFVPNGIDHDTFRAARQGERKALREKHGLPAEAMLALFVARPVPKKGFPVLMAATSPAYVVVTVGGHATGLDESGQVLHLGPMETGDVAEIMRASDVFVLPSVSEGFPLTVQEAMASGLAILTTDDEGYSCYDLDRSLIRLVEPEAAVVRRHLGELAEDAELRGAMAAYSVDYARTRFSWETHRDVLLQVYAEATRS